MLQNFSFKTKLLFLCCLLSLVSIAVGAMGYFSLQTVSGKYASIAEKSLPKVEFSDQMYQDFRGVRISLRSLGLSGLTPERAQAVIKAAQADITEYENDRKTYLALGFSPGQKERYEKVDAIWTEFKEMGERIVGLYNSGRPEDRVKMVDIFWNECPERAKKFDDAIDELTTFHKRGAEEKAASAEMSVKNANITVFVVILAGTFFGLLAGLFFATSLSKTLDNIAKGLLNGADLVEQASSSIASASQQLSGGATEQAAAIQETTAALDETSAMIAKNSDSAKKSAEVSSVSQKTVAQGKEAVESMMVSIGEISRSNTDVMQQVEHGNREIEAIVKVIAEIGNKTKVINEIVFQTKLLSFNASVEAARAGEHGKGFAVVAEEVGNLAQMSGAAAKEITEMLDSSILKVGQIVQDTKSRVDGLMVTSKEKIQSGIVTAQKCGELLEAIVHNVNEVSEMVVDISVASQEQTRGVQEINKAMNQLDAVSQQNSVASNNVAGSAQDLQSQVNQLRTMVAQLNQTVQGHSTTRPLVKASRSEKSSQHPNKVVSLQKKSGSAVATEHVAKVKQVANGSSEIPSAFDTRFKDI